jgi:hypothetical protein
VAETLLLDDTSNLNTVTYVHDDYSIYQGPGERVASWADPLSRVEINFHFYGAFRRMMLPPSMSLICKIFFIMDLFQRAGFTWR